MTTEILMKITDSYAQRYQKLLPTLAALTLAIILAPGLVQAQAAKSPLKIVSPKRAANTQLLSSDGSLSVRFSVVAGAAVDSLQVQITTDHDGWSKKLPLPDGTGERLLKLPLFRGMNTVRIFGAKGQEVGANAEVFTVECEDSSCGNAKHTVEIKNASEDNSEDGDDAVPDPKDDTQPKKSALKISSADALMPDVSEAQISFTRTDKKIDYIILNYAGATASDREPIRFGDNDTVAAVVRLVNGPNEITALGFNDKNKKIAEATRSISVSVAAKAEQINLGKPFTVRNNPLVTTNFEITDPRNVITKLYYKVTNSGGITIDEGTQDRTAGLSQTLNIRLTSGANKLFVAGIKADQTRVAAAQTTIECLGACGAPSATGPSLELPPPFTAAHQSDAVVVVKPNDPQNKIASYAYEVRNKDGLLLADEPKVDVIKGADEKAAPQKIAVRIGDGRNTVSVVAKDEAGNRITEPAITTIDCFECKDKPSVEQGNGRNTRAILGFEQSGGSGTDSDQKPFLDFFFTAPLFGTNQNPARFSTWGSLRFAAVPTQQLASGGLGIQNFAGNFLTNFQAVQVNELVQGFDFLAGIQFKIAGGRNTLGASPGTFQKTAISLITGFGAINPFSKRQSAQVFVIPKTSDGKVDPEFLKLFPEAEGKTNIAFVTPERDRFFRQYYGGFRFNTYFFDKHGDVINGFPAMLDVTFGQNEIVTGKLRNAVFRLEGFYPFPFAAKLLYLYGTAMMKVGGGGVKTNLPLFLSPVTSLTLPDPNTVIVPIDRNPNLRSNRDYYRIGVGINLMELLDKLRNRTN